MKHEDVYHSHFYKRLLSNELQELKSNIHVIYEITPNLYQIERPAGYDIHFDAVKIQVGLKEIVFGAHVLSFSYIQ